jgi:threonine/homoserine/homoserine lactone efflux protein
VTVQRLVQSVALAASLAALGVSLWRGESAFSVLKRAGIAYLAFFAVGALLALAYRAGVAAEGRPASAPPPPGGAPAANPGDGPPK